MKSTPSTSQVPCLQKFPGQSAHPIPVPGAGFGVPFFVPRVCCMNPEMSACFLPRWLGDTPVAPLFWPCVAVSIWDTRSVSWTPWPLSLSIPTLLRRPCGCRKNPGLGIKLNPAQIPSSAILTAGGILDKWLHLSQPQFPYLWKEHGLCCPMGLCVSSVRGYMSGGTE